MKIGIPNDDFVDGYNASISKGRVREVTEEDRWGLKAQKKGLFVALHYTIREGERILKEVQLERGIH